MAASEPFARMGDVVDAALDLALRVADNLDRLVDDAISDVRGIAREASALAVAARERSEMLYDFARATPRFARVVGEGVRLLALHRIAEARRRVVGDDPEADARLHADTAQRLYDLCIELRGGVLKLGQFASSRVDLLPPVYVEALSRLQDRVPPAPGEAIRARIESELGSAQDRLHGLEEAPLAAASLAQVHGARLDGERAVVVKVQVPGVEDDVRADLAALRVLVPLLGELLPGVDLETIAGELSRSVAGELDYEREAEHALAFAERYAGDPDVVIPGVIGEFTSKRVLVLERVEGQRIVDFLDACERRGEAGARDRDHVLGTLVRSLADQVLTYGLVHADPHPGNFLVDPAGEKPRLVILDFGSVQHYDPERRRAWATLGLAILQRDEARLTGLFQTLGFESRGGDDSLRAFAELLLEHFRPGAGFELGPEFDPRERIALVLGLLRENPIVRIPGDFVQLGRIFAAVGGLLLRYRPRIDLFGILAPRLSAAAIATAPTPD